MHMHMHMHMYMHMYMAMYRVYTLASFAWESVTEPHWLQSRQRALQRFHYSHSHQGCVDT